MAYARSFSGRGERDGGEGVRFPFPSFVADVRRESQQCPRKNAPTSRMGRISSENMDQKRGATPVVTLGLRMRRYEQAGERMTSETVIAVAVWKR